MNDDLAPIPKNEWSPDFHPWAKSPELSDAERAEYARPWDEKHSRKGRPSPAPPPAGPVEGKKLAPTKENRVGETKPEGSLTLPFAPISEVLQAMRETRPGSFRDTFLSALLRSGAVGRKLESRLFCSRSSPRCRRERRSSACQRSEVAFSCLPRSGAELWPQRSNGGA